METVNSESIPIAVGREEDGRWWADIESMPGVMAYGPTRETAIAANLTALEKPLPDGRGSVTHCSTEPRTLVSGALATAY